MNNEQLTNEWFIRTKYLGYPSLTGHRLKCQSFCNGVLVTAFFRAWQGLDFWEVRNLEKDNIKF